MFIVIRYSIVCYLCCNHVRILFFLKIFSQNNRGYVFCKIHLWCPEGGPGEIRDDRLFCDSCGVRDGHLCNCSRTGFCRQLRRCCFLNGFYRRFFVQTVFDPKPPLLCGCSFNDNGKKETEINNFKRVAATPTTGTTGLRGRRIPFGPFASSSTS